VDVSAIRKGPVYTLAMKNTRLALLLVALAFATLLAGCGNKGPLVRPDAAADAGATP